MPWTQRFKTFVQQVRTWIWGPDEWTFTLRARGSEQLPDPQQFAARTEAYPDLIKTGHVELTLKKGRREITGCEAYRRLQKMKTDLFAAPAGEARYVLSDGTRCQGPGDVPPGASLREIYLHGRLPTHPPQSQKD